MTTMKVCLISAPTANQLNNPAVGEMDAERIMGELAPVGILSLAAVLEAQGLEPQVIDLNRVYYEWLQHCGRSQGNAQTDLCGFAGSNLADRDFDFFGFSTVCSSYPLTLRIAREVKRHLPESVVALGGPQASVVDISTMGAYSFVDLVVRGEAEQTLPNLLDALESKSPLAAIPGLTFRRKGDIVRSPDAPLILELDSLPFPAFHLFPDIRFCRHFPLELGRGCPFACTFCSTNDFFRRRFRLKSPAQMIADMRRVKQTYAIDSFELIHDMFTVDRKLVAAFCEALLACNEKFYWGSSARTDCIDEELIALMAKAGCRGIFFGIETGSRRMQKIIDKGLELSDSAARVRSCDKFKITTAVSLIAGFPDETMDDLRDTAAFFADSLRYDYADPQLSILSPLADTPIHNQYKDALVLDDSASDMSYRGWKQQPEDCEMIADHAEIFSSFYSVPNPVLEREFLKELRDFLLNGAKTFRWLLVGLDQDSGNVFNVFRQWQQWRAKNQLCFPGNDRAAYYAQGRFPEDFLQFVQWQYVPAASRAPVAIATLADYESLLLSLRHSTDELQRGHAQVTLDAEEPMSADSSLELLPGVSVTQLRADYVEIVRRLREKRSLDDVPKREITLAIRRTPGKSTAVLQLSPLSAELLHLCEGGRTVREIAEEFFLGSLEVPGVPPDLACLAGIELLRQQGLIGLARSSAAPGVGSGLIAAQTLRSRNR